MRRSSLFHKFLCLPLVYFVAVSSILTPSQAYAVYEGVRGIDDHPTSGTQPAITFDAEKNKCDTSSIAFLPTGVNDDFNIKLDNPTCIAFIAASGAVMLAADITARLLCKAAVTYPPNAAKSAEETVSETALGPPIPYPTPILPVRLAMKSGQCAFRAGSAITACAGPQAVVLCAPASADVAMCCGSVAAYLVAAGLMMAALAIIWNQSVIAYEDARICGHGWSRWARFSPEIGGTGSDGEVSTGGKWVKTRGPHLLRLQQLFAEKYPTSPEQDAIDSYKNDSPNLYCDDYSTTRNITNRCYREFIYGGVEFEDNGDNSCDNPSNWDTAKKNQILGYSSNKQRYYMTGPGNAPVYACHRFIATTKDESERSAIQAAYDCCKRRSQNAVCLQHRTGFGGIRGEYQHGFCEIGSRCSVANITFEAFASRSQPNYACIKSYSVCPYDHLLGGGTEQRKYNSSDPAIVDNFCQFMNHCSKLPVLPYIRTHNFEGEFISAACHDMKGDSQNVYGYTSELVPINTRGFSAPMIQCFKETMENVFLHKAGHTKCLNADETPNRDGICQSGYVYREGQTMSGKSFFVKIQDNLQEVIKIALTMSIVLFGMAILLAVPQAYVTKKVLLIYVLKIGLVMYFAVGDAWQNQFMTGVLNSSTFLADLTFKIDESAPPEKLDGCQFPRFNYADSSEATKYDIRQYPPDKDYLRVWDTLDCKIARALGFGPEVSVPNLVLMILGGFFTGGLGIVFFVGAFIFAFFLIALTVKALHIFLMSITSVIILIYVSPITITLAFFAKTKGVFDGWWKQMLGFTLQPMILFAYLGIMITIFDKMIIGADVTFSGTSDDPHGRRTPKSIVCNSAAQDSSIYCIFRIADIKTYTGLEVLGIGLPMLGSINGAKLENIIRAALVMFILTKFMDKITEFAAALVGGAELKSDWNISAAGMAAKSYAALRQIQTRAMHGLKKHGGKVARKGVEGMKGLAHAAGDKGKAIKAPSSPGGVTAAVGPEKSGVTEAVRETGSDGGDQAVATGDSQ